MLKRILEMSAKERVNIVDELSDADKKEIMDRVEYLEGIRFDLEFDDPKLDELMKLLLVASYIE